MLGVKTIRITPDLMLCCGEVDEFKGLWSGLESYTTSLNLLGEVAAHGAKVQRILTPLQDKEITPQIIKMLHAAQMGERGMSEYKIEENLLPVEGADGLVGHLETAPPEQVEALMDKLCDWMNGVFSDRSMHPLVAIAVFVAVFLQISPFKEGNMRIVRFLILLLMLKGGYKYAPFVPLDKAMKEHGQEIYKTLLHNQKTLAEGVPDWTEWLSCFFDLLRAQKEVLLERINEKEKDLSSLPTLSARVMRLFEEHDRLQMKDIVKLTRGRRSTLKLRLGELVEQGYLRRHGTARSTWYSQV